MVAQVAPWTPEPWWQEPAFFTHPEFDYTAGYRIADFVSELTFKGEPFVPDPNQRNLLAVTFAGPPGATFKTRSLKWATSRDVWIAPRQNIKTSTAMMATIGAALVLGAEKITWSSHVFNPTTREAFEDMQQLIDENPTLRRRALRPTTASGREAIRFRDSQRIRYVARNKNTARGTGGDLIIFDEGFALQKSHVGALAPTKNARPNAKSLVMSSAGMIDSQQLRYYRDIGRVGYPRTSYTEWCGLSAVPDSGVACSSACQHAPGTPGCVLDDVEEWHRANCALHRRIEVSTLEDARGEMTWDEFAREIVGWWDEPKGGTVIPMSRWAPLGREPHLSRIDGPVCVFADVTLDRKQSVVAVCGDAGGVPQVEIAAMADGTDWVVGRIADMIDRHGVTAVGARSAGPVTSLLPQLRGVCDDAGTEFVKVGSGEHAAHCGAFFDAVMSGRLSHLADTRLDAALAGARKHQVVDAWSWERSRVNPDAAPLVAVTGALALHALKSDDVAYDPVDNIW